MLCMPALTLPSSLLGSKPREGKTQQHPPPDDDEESLWAAVGDITAEDWAMVEQHHHIKSGSPTSTLRDDDDLADTTHPQTTIGHRPKCLASSLSVLQYEPQIPQTPTTKRKVIPRTPQTPTPQWRRSTKVFSETPVSPTRPINITQNIYMSAHSASIPDTPTTPSTVRVPSHWKQIKVS